MHKTLWQAIILAAVAASTVAICYWAGDWGTRSTTERILLLIIATTLALLGAIIWYHVLYHSSIVLEGSNGETFAELTTYNEDLTSISRDLTTYYSCFSADSYRGIGTQWLNLSKTLQNVSSCSANDYADSHMKWDTTPSYSTRDGFLLGPNRIRGPESHRIGLSANGAFSIFIFARFTNLSPNFSRTTTSESSRTLQSPDLELFTLYANTPSNHGVRMFIRNNTIKPRPGGAKVEMAVELGGSLTSSAFVFPLTIDSDRFIDLDYENNYLFVIVKEYSGLRVHMYRAPDSSRIDLLKKNMDPTAFKFSNQELMLNRGANVNAQIYAYGTYAKSLSDSELNDLQLHLYEQLSRQEPKNQEIAAKMASLVQQIQTFQSCPYDKSVCTACGVAVKDWSNWNTVITNADTVCLEAINRFCIANPNHPYCGCWNSNSLTYNSNACRSYRNVFSGENKVNNVDGLDDATLAIIKKKYNLCGDAAKDDGLPPKDDLMVSVDGCRASSSIQASTGVTEVMPVSGFTGKTNNEVVNYFETAKASALNSTSRVLANKIASQMPIKKIITDPFNDLGKANFTGSGEVKSWWNKGIS